MERCCVCDELVEEGTLVCDDCGGEEDYEEDTQEEGYEVARCPFVDDAIFDAFGATPPWRR